MSVTLPDPRALFPDGVALPVPAAPTAAIAPWTVAVLCDPANGVAAACAVALALGAAAGARCAIAMAVGHDERAALPLAAAAGRNAAGLRERGYDAAAVGRLIWLADLRVSRRRAPSLGETDGVGSSATRDRRIGLADRTALSGGRSAGRAERTGSPDGIAQRGDPAEDDPVGAVAAASLELAGAARAVGVPAAVAIPLARTTALDRVLGWHDGIVVVDDERTTMPELAELARESVAALDRPVAAMTLPSRLQKRAAVAGLRVPDEAARAVTDLGLAPR